ncbi:MAG TPA: hypothetical protein VFY89_03955 [Ktedonobacterales bacterium]
MTPSYIQIRHGNIYVGPSRVTLESVITLWLMRRTPEQIQEDFPSLPLAAVYGAIADYLAHREKMDAFFAEMESLDRARQASEESANPEFFARRRQRLAEARERGLAKPLLPATALISADAR